MKRLFALMLGAALAFSLVACGGGDGAPENEKEEVVIPGTYESAGLLPGDAYVLNENGSYDHGEEKGTYTVGEETGTIVLQSKSGASESALTACGAYYHTGAKMAEDTEYGLAPSFNESGVSNQTFQLMVGETDLTLELREDGSFSFSYSKESPVYFKLEDVVAYEGSYTLEDNILNLNWNGSDYPMLFADEVIYPIVYIKETEENGAAIEAAQAALQSAVDEAAQGRWWTPVDEALAAEIREKLQGTWEQSDTYSLYRLKFEGSDCSLHTEFLGVTAANRYGEYVIGNRAILHTFQNENVFYTNAIPYTYVDGTLTLYEIDSLHEETSLDPAMDFVAASDSQYQKVG